MTKYFESSNFVSDNLVIATSGQLPANKMSLGLIITFHVYYFISGILLNVYGGQLSKLSSQNATLVINKVSTALDLNHIQEINRFSSDIPINANTSQSAMETNHPNGNGAVIGGQELDLTKIEQLEAQSENVVNLLNSQILTLELLSNAIFVDDDDDENELEDESGDSAVEDFDDSVQEDADMDVENGDGDSSFVSGVKKYFYFWFIW